MKKADKRKFWAMAAALFAAAYALSAGAEALFRMIAGGQ